MNAKTERNRLLLEILDFHNLFFKVYIMAPSAYKNKKQPLALTIAKVWGKNQL